MNYLADTKNVREPILELVLFFGGLCIFAILVAIMGAVFITKKGRNKNVS